MKIQYLKNNEIDYRLWDYAITMATNGNVFGYTWHLDIVSPGWHALVSENYEYIMPLPRKKKAGIVYLIQPFLTQQLGIYSRRAPVPLSITKAFIEKATTHFRYIHLLLNEAMDEVPEMIEKTKNTTYKVSLDREYKEIYESFNRNCHRNIRKAIQSGLVIRDIESAETFACFIRQQLNEQFPVFTKENKAQLINIIHESQKRNLCIMKGAFNKEGEMEAAGLFLKSNNNLYFTVCASTPSGKQQQAMYLLVSETLLKHASLAGYFDFVGSNIPGIAYFNSTFGSTAYSYFSIKINRLPILLRWLKK